MDKCKPTKTPISLGTKLTKNDDGPTINSTLYKIMVGSLMYLTTTRPYLMYVFSLISRLWSLPKTLTRKLEKEFSDMLHAHLDMAFGILIH